jgi:hypothetical protein
MENDCQKVLTKYPNYIPALILPDKDIEICKRRFLLPRCENFGFCMASIRRNIKLKPSEAIFFMIDSKMISTNQNVGEFYDTYRKQKNPDTAYLLIQIIKEKTFGYTKTQRIYRNVPWIKALQK